AAKGDHDVLDLAEYTKKQPWWRKTFGSSTGSNTEKYNVATQLVIGGVTGCNYEWGQLLRKTYLVATIANHTGYIKIDWNLVEQDMHKAKEQLKFHGNKNKLAPEVKSRVDEVISFLKKNVILTGGFAGGFLLGMAS
uniref:FUN14 domain-containing protein 2 n=1 Tax=Sphenodon punctatus TaxID=8508 RepID=A0A8D0HJK4_SPHPU